MKLSDLRETPPGEITIVDWKQWEGDVVDGRFHLRQFLGGSAHNACFLTDYGQGTPQEAVIKLFPADAATTHVWLTQRESAAKLSHPGLISIFQIGTDELNGVGLVYAVMERSDEDLSQVISTRALAPAEAREMVPPVLETLAYLHAEGFVHGCLTPANIMAAGDRVKISSDGLLRIGELRDPLSEQNVNGPPDAQLGLTPAGDVWSLGMTLVEVLTQRSPNWDSSVTNDPVIPEEVPAPFLDIARRCLRSDPQLRCSLAEVALALQPGTPALTRNPSVVETVPTAKTTSVGAGKNRRYLLQAAGAILLTGAIVTGARLWWSPSGTGPEGPQSSARVASREKPETVPSPPSAQAVAPTTHDKTPGAPKPTGLSPRNDNAADRLAASDVVERFVPKVPPRILGTIRGKVIVRVRVRVDRSGVVADAKLDSRAGSKYFEKVALDAASRWRFRPAHDEGHDAESIWRIRFEFRKNGCEVFSSQTQP